MNLLMLLKTRLLDGASDGTGGGGGGGGGTGDVGTSDLGGDTLMDKFIPPALVELYNLRGKTHS